MNEAARILELLDYLEITQNRLAKKTRYPQPTVFRYLSGEVEIPKEFLNAVLAAYPVNREWLYFGEGKKFDSDYFKSRWEEGKNEPKTMPDKLKYLQSVFDCSESHLASKIGLSRSYLGKVLAGQYSISESKKNEFPLRIKFIPMDWWDD